MLQIRPPSATISFVYSLDVRLALRFLRRNPAFTIAIVLTLALGIGANAAAYNIVYNVLFRPLPFHEPSRLAQLWETNPPSHNCR